MFKKIYNTFVKYKYLWLYKKNSPYLIDYLCEVVTPYTPKHNNQLEYLSKMLFMCSLVYDIPIVNVWKFYTELSKKLNIGKLHTLTNDKFTVFCRIVETNLNQNAGLLK